MTFELSKKQCQKFKIWQKKLKKVDIGAIGGRFTFCFTPTGVGTSIKIVDGITKKELNLSDCEDW